MDLSLKEIDPNSSTRSTSNIINNIHSMSWLKQDSCSSSKNGSVHRIVGKDGKIISAKKTDEDYFPGTREQKKAKKKKEKKGKSVLTIDGLEDLVILTQQREKQVTTTPDFQEISIYNPPNVQKEPKLASIINTTPPVDDTAWSTTTNTADKLFPNVQSVTIDRLEDEEMLSRAIAESIATVQLEQFKRLPPEKEDQWEALYGDTDDEGGWDNVKRNLPSALDTMNSRNDASGGRKSCDNNNNSSKPGIIRNKQKNLCRHFAKAEALDFCFKKCSESLKDETEATQSLKSVSFDESIAVKVRSSESSENDESYEILRNGDNKGPNIDKFGRIDGYSERRLFMGKGARMKEQEYIQNKCNLGIGDTRNQISESNLQSIAIIKTQKPAITAPQCRNDGRSEKPIVNIKAQNVSRKPKIRNQQFKSNSQATAIPKTQKSAICTSHSPKNLQSQSQSQKSIPDLNNSEIEEPNASKNFHAAPETPRDIEQIPDNVKKLNESVRKSPTELVSSSHNSTIYDSTESSIGISSSVKLEPETSKTTELKSIEREVQPLKETENKEIRRHIAPNASLGIRTKEEEINHRKNELLVSFNTETSHSDNGTEFTSSFDESKSPLRRAEMIEQKDVEDLQENILTQDMMSKNFTTLLTIADNLSEQKNSEEGSESKDYCLVPTLDREDGYVPNFFETSLQYADSMAAMSHNAEFQSSARQNLLLAGILDLDTSCDDQSLMTRGLDFQNLQYQNYPVNDSVNLNNVLPQFHSLNNLQHIQTESMRSENQIYQNTPITLLPNLNSNTYSMPPNYMNPINKAQMDQTEYAYFCAQNFPYHNAGLLANPDHCNVSNFMRSGRNVWSSTRFKDLGPITDRSEVRPREKTGNDRQRFSTTQVPPGVIKNLQLPPGFVKKESYQRHNMVENNLVINSPAVTRSMRDVESQKRQFGNKKSVPQSTKNYSESMSRHPAQNRPAHYERNSMQNYNYSRQTSHSSSNRQQDYYRLRTDLKRREPQFAENRKVPYPILGASQNSPEKRNNFQSNNSKFNQMSELRGVAVNNRLSNTSESVLSTVNDNTRKNSVGPISNNNNEFTTSSPNTTSELDRQRMNNFLQSSNIKSPFATPVTCQIPDQQSSGSSDMANWRYHANFMNPTQQPMKFASYYQVPISDPHNLHVNVPPDYFNTPTHQNPEIQQFPIHMLCPVQMPVHAIPHVLNPEGNDDQHVRPENMKSPEANLMMNYDSSVKMIHAGSLRAEAQGSILGDYRYANYNLNETPMSQFVTNSNFCETRTVPNVQNSWHVYDNQTNRNTDQIFDNSNIGRGRGRLPKTNLP